MERQRNAGTALPSGALFPDFASLHPGYCLRSLKKRKRTADRRASLPVTAVRMREPLVAPYFFPPVASCLPRSSSALYIAWNGGCGPVGAGAGAGLAAAFLAFLAAA